MVHQAAFTRGEEGDGDAFFTGAPGAADAMDVIFAVRRQVVVDHVRDVFDIQAARRHIRGNQHGNGMLAEAVEYVLAPGLVQIAVQSFGRVAALHQFIGQFLGAYTRAGENEGAGHFAHFDQAGEQG